VSAVYTGDLAVPMPLLATNARTLTAHGGPCPVCHHALLAGERAADLPDGRTVHVAGCAAKTGGTR
jgi:hypothetical protein